MWTANTLTYKTKNYSGGSLSIQPVLPVRPVQSVQLLHLVQSLQSTFVIGPLADSANVSVERQPGNSNHKYLAHSKKPRGCELTHV